MITGARFCREAGRTNITEFEIGLDANLKDFPVCLCSARPTGGRNEINLLFNEQLVSLHGPSKRLYFYFRNYYEIVTHDWQVSSQFFEMSFYE